MPRPKKSAQPAPKKPARATRAAPSTPLAAVRHTDKRANIPTEDALRTH